MQDRDEWFYRQERYSERIYYRNIDRLFKWASLALITFCVVFFVMELPA